MRAWRRVWAFFMGGYPCHHCGGEHYTASCWLPYLQG